METKENTKLIGKLYLYRDIPVLVLKEYSTLSKSIYPVTFEKYIKCEVLFPQGGIDTVSAKVLKEIKT